MASESQWCNVDQVRPRELYNWHTRRSRSQFSWSGKISLMLSFSESEREGLMQMNCRQEQHSVRALHCLQHTLVVCLRQTMLIKHHGWIHYAQFHSQNSQNRLEGAVTAESLRMARLVNQCCKISLQLSNDDLIENTVSETIRSHCEWIRAHIPWRGLPFT